MSMVLAPLLIAAAAGAGQGFASSRQNAAARRAAQQAERQRQREYLLSQMISIAGGQGAISPGSPITVPQSSSASDILMPMLSNVAAAAPGAIGAYQSGVNQQVQAGTYGGTDPTMLALQTQGQQQRDYQNALATARLEGQQGQNEWMEALLDQEAGVPTPQQLMQGRAQGLGQGAGQGAGQGLGAAVSRRNSLAEFMDWLRRMRGESSQNTIPYIPGSLRP